MLLDARCVKVLVGPTLGFSFVSAIRREQSAVTDSSKSIEFSELFTAQHARLYGYIRTLVLDANDANDVFQQTALTLWRKFDDFDRSRDFGAWAVGVARNKALDHFKVGGRRKARFSNILVEELAELQEKQPETSELLTARKSALAACLKTLNGDQTDLVRRCYDGSETVREVSRSLRRSTHSVYSSLRHIRRKLLGCIESRLRTDIQGRLRKETDLG